MARIVSSVICHLPRDECKQDYQKDAECDTRGIQTDDGEKAPNALNARFGVRSYLWRKAGISAMEDPGRECDQCEDKEEQSKKQMYLREQVEDNGADYQEQERVHGKLYSA